MKLFLQPNQVGSYKKQQRLRLTKMISEIMLRKRNYEGILGKYRINYLTEIDLLIHIALLLYRL